jgi:hypothetical protein
VPSESVEPVASKLTGLPVFSGAAVNAATGGWSGLTATD